MKGYFLFGHPMIDLDITGIPVDVLIDTGFTGHIMLPQSIIDELKLPQVGVEGFITATGEETLTNVYTGTVLIEDILRQIPIMAAVADISLAGMSLFRKNKIVIEQQANLVEIV